jgi:hypothetical protein
LLALSPWSAHAEPVEGHAWDGPPADSVHAVALAGDWHGNTAWAVERISDVSARGISVLLHAGDFGLWPGPSGKRYLSRVEAACAEHGVAVLVVPGNHEDWGRLEQLWASPKRRTPDGRTRPVYLSEHVAFLPRPWRWEMGGRTFVALGGAASLDRHRRTEGRSWWPAEVTTPEQVADTVEGGAGDVLITHEAPHDDRFHSAGVADVLSSNSFGWSDEALRLSELSRRRIQEAANAVRPSLWVHGHMHTSGTRTGIDVGWGHTTTVWSLGADNSAGNLRYLDLATLTDLDVG